MMKDWVIGIDLGGTKIAIGLVNPDDEIVATRRFPTEVKKGPQDAIDRIAESIADLSRESRIEVKSVGVCCPGPVDHETGVIVDPPNLGWRNVPFRKMLSDKLGLPVSLEHDAKAAALGEFFYGAGQEHYARDLVYVIVGTGVGAAIILDGQLYRGRNNASGEIGHVTIDRNGASGSSGVIGCVESQISGPNLVKRYRKLSGNNDTALTGEKIARLANEGDENALAVMNDAGDALGAAVATMASLMDVDLFVIGGSVSRSGDLLLAPARNALPKYAIASIASRIKIVATQLHEDAPILGCAWQARGMKK
jgi:glucokinase